jgi:3-oxoadipate enol-lactonase
MKGHTELSYDDFGKGTPIVLIHGFCGSRDYWQELVPLLKEEYRLVAVDLRGHGNSPCSEGQFEIEDMAVDIFALMKKLNLDGVYVFGHSLGGYITLALAEQFPDMVKGFSLVHSTAFPDSEEAKAGRLQSVKTIGERGIKEFVDGLVPKLFADQSDSHIETAKRIGYKTSIIGATGSLLAMRNRVDRNHVLKNTNVPVLLLAGGKDKIISPEKTFSVKDEKYIKTVILEDSGHMGMLENARKVAKEIKKFVPR